MTDSLFCMQRYWGSDDEDCSNQNSSLNNTPRIFVSDKKFSNKKKLVTNDILSVKDLEVLDYSITTKSSNLTETNSSKKKRGRKGRMKYQTETVDKSEESIVSISSQTPNGTVQISSHLKNKIHTNINDIKRLNKKQELDLTFDTIENDIETLSDSTATKSPDLIGADSSGEKSLKKVKTDKRKYQTETDNKSEESNVSLSQISINEVKSFSHLKNKIRTNVNDIEILYDSVPVKSSDLTQANSMEKKSLEKEKTVKRKYQTETDNKSEESNVSVSQTSDDTVKGFSHLENKICADINDIKKLNKKQKLDRTIENDIEILSDSVLFITENTPDSVEKCILENKSSKERKSKKQYQIGINCKSHENSFSSSPNLKSTLEKKDLLVKGYKLTKVLSECTNDASPVSNSDEDSDLHVNPDENKKKYKLKDLKQAPNKKSIQELPKSKSSENTDENFCTIGQVLDKKDVNVRQTLPNWLSNPTYIDVNLEEEKTAVSELCYLDGNTKKNLKDANIKYLFPVQFSVIPYLMQNKEHCRLIRPSDICVSAPTGSGKTLAFVLPIIESLKDRVVCAIRAIVVLPVSELAIQVYKVFETFIRGTDLKVTLLTGQKSFLAEQNALVKRIGQKVHSLVDIVVTTPGRIYDHMYRTKGFCLRRLQYLVIDEADRMMEEIQQGWLKQVEDAVFAECSFVNCACLNNKRNSMEPSSAFNFGFINQPLQKLLYSATLTHDPEQLHSLSLYKPKLFTASNTDSEVYIGTCAIPNKLTMLQAICEENIKPMVVCHLIKTCQFKRVLCFTESVERAHRLHFVLEEMDMFPVREISSFNRAVQRKIVLEQFASGKINILICSDLVARGIDIEDIDCVISYDVPQFVKTYIHRIGRTARAGKGGTAVTLLSEGEIPHLKRTLKSAGIGMPKRVDIASEDLKPFISSYQNALLAADTKLKKEKFLAPGKSSQKTKRKRNLT